MNFKVTYECPYCHSKNEFSVNSVDSFEFDHCVGCGNQLAISIKQIMGPVKNSTVFLANVFKLVPVNG